MDNKPGNIRADNLQSTNLHTGSAAQQAGQSTGMLNGQRVMTKSAMSMVTDNLEEIPQKLSGKVKDKDLKNRKADSGKKMREMLMKLVSQIQKTLGSSDPSMSAKMNSFLNAIKAMQGASAKDVLGAVKEQFENVGEQHAALYFAEKMLAEELGEDHPDVKAIQQAKLELVDESGKEIRAANKFDEAYASVKSSNMLSKDAMQVISELYDAKVLGQETSKQVYDAISKMDGGLESFMDVCDAFSSALDRYYTAQGSFMDMKEVSVLINDFAIICHLKNELQLMDETMIKTQKHFEEPPKYERLPERQEVIGEARRKRLEAMQADKRTRTE